jgi:hypothetical protein
MDFRRVKFLPVFFASLILSAELRAETIRFHGTIGQQAVMLTLEVQDQLVTEARYKYDSQTAEVPIPESRLFGSTIVLADDDGNNFHLHLQDAAGTSVTSFSKAMKLAGTMDREELDLPVKLVLVHPARP